MSDPQETPSPPPIFPFRPTALPHPEDDTTPLDVEPTPPPPTPPLSHSILEVIPTLNVDVQYLYSPIEVLSTLPPATLLQALLGRGFTRWHWATLFCNDRNNMGGSFGARMGFCNPS
ncbi:hypothetical protein [Neosynechococcus sphagnicola]|uniref:hypothetical protein n=1 Tax=Neosynechococcus sphagnicola TaxID=1501145 RepID=UPI0012E03936|nr:hypothetical protein [Neosynechococcus sphagnicola]